MKRWLIVTGVLALIIAISLNACAQLDQFGNLRLGNEYIEIVVNGNEENMGRFAVDITGGNPITSGDDGEPLIYGRPKPWTSYSTVFLDGEYYVFGGKTEQRAGREANYGEVVLPPTIISDSGQKAITTTGLFGNIEVEQILTFSKSSTTGLFDTVLIKYRFTNLDEIPHKIGLRVMMDTMLGTNDGAPFRVGEKAITTDTYFIKGNLPDFWQAFDALSNPKVTAQGTIKGPDVTIPDKVYFADWGSMADGLWEFKFDPGQEFWREGEFELDSAIALYWAPMMLEPGQSQTYVTKYGLGGITVVPGLLSLGVTSPAEVIFDTQTTSFPVVAYIENTSEIVTKDVTARIILPEGFEVAGSESMKDLGNLQPGSTAQVAWNVIPVPGHSVPANITYTVKVEASNTDSNQVQRQVSFTPPPTLTTKLEYPTDLGVQEAKLSPNPFDLLVKIKNEGGSPAYEVKTQVVLPPGLDFAAKEKMSKYIGMLNPGEEYLIPWKVKVLDEIYGKMPFEVDIFSLNSQKNAIIGNLNIPKLNNKLYLIPLKQEIRVGEYFGVQIKVANVEDMSNIALNLTYDPIQAKAMYVSRGTIFILDDDPLPWNEPLVDREQGLISGIGGDLSNSILQDGVIGEIYFKAVQTGPLVLKFSELLFTDSNGDPVTINTEDLTLEIRE